MQSVSSRIWTHDAVSISYNDNHYTTANSIFASVYLTCSSAAREVQQKVSF